MIQYCAAPHIYKLTLLEDVGIYKKGSIYIGKHGSACQARYFTGGKIPRSIARELGREVFSREIITKGPYNEALLDSLERHYIQLYASNVKGLNLSKGGSGLKPIPAKPVSQYDLSGMFIREFNSVSTAAKHIDKRGSLILSFLAPSSTLKSAHGYLWSRERSSTIPPLQRNERAQEVHSYLLTGEYQNSYGSREEAGRVFSVTANSIKAAIDKEHKSAADRQWRSYKQESVPKYTKRRDHLKKGNEVVMFYPNGSQAKVYPSVSAASKETGISFYSIIRSCIGEELSSDRYGGRNTFKFLKQPEYTKGMDNLKTTIDKFAYYFTDYMTVMNNVDRYKQKVG